MKFPQLMLLHLSAKTKADQVLAQHNEQFKVEAFLHLACWMLSQFASHDGLSMLQATSVYRTVESKDEQLVEVGHHLKLSASGADVGLTDTATYEELLHELAPVQFLGEGSFVLNRSTDLVSEFIAALERSDDEVAEATIYRLASRLVPAIGKLQVVHRLNSFM